MLYQVSHEIKIEVLTNGHVDLYNFSASEIIKDHMRRDSSFIVSPSI